MSRVTIEYPKSSTINNRMTYVPSKPRKVSRTYSGESTSSESSSKKVSFGGSSSLEFPPEKQGYSGSKKKSILRNKFVLGSRPRLTYIHETKEMLLRNHHDEVCALICGPTGFGGRSIGSAKNPTTSTAKLSLKNLMMKKTETAEQPKQFTIYGITPMYSGQQNSIGDTLDLSIGTMQMLQQNNNRRSNISHGGADGIVFYEWATIEAKKGARSKSMFGGSSGKLRLCLELAAKTKEERKRFTAKEFAKDPEKKWLVTIQNDIAAQDTDKKETTVTLNHCERSSEMMMQQQRKSSSSASSTTSASSGGSTIYGQAVEPRMDPKSCVSYLACAKEFIEIICYS